MWSTEKTLRLIEHLQSYICLWNIESVDYKNTDERVMRWISYKKKYELQSAEIK